MRHRQPGPASFPGCSQPSPSPAHLRGPPPQCQQAIIRGHEDAAVLLVGRDRRPFAAR